MNISPEKLTGFASDGFVTFERLIEPSLLAELHTALMKLTGSRAVAILMSRVRYVMAGRLIKRLPVSC